MKKSAATRQNILYKAFELIYVNGYQATSIDDIIATTEVTKGAFYYHFKTKEEMGLAIIEEMMQGTMRAGLIDPLTATDDPLEAIYTMMSDLLIHNPVLQLKYGCPTYNLIQEMAPLNEHFNTGLANLMKLIREQMTSALDRARDSGRIKPGTDSAGVADFVMAGYGGIRIIGKLHQDKSCYHSYLKQLKFYLDSLR